MKTIICLLFALVLFASSNVLAEETETHLFDDLNNNQISDTEEARNNGEQQQQESSQAEGNEVEDIELPPTPDEVL